MHAVEYKSPQVSSPVEFLTRVPLELGASADSEIQELEMAQFLPVKIDQP